jgi:hypothetical protein
MIFQPDGEFSENCGSQAFKVEDWYVRSGGWRHLLSMIRSDEEPHE